MEDQASDCIEDYTCDLVRDEADRITGAPEWKRRLAQSKL